MSNVSRRNDGFPSGFSPGFSVVEVLIAAGIFLVIAMGVLPLFTSAIVRNRAGAESTVVSHFGISRVEEVLELNFNDISLDPSTTQQYYSNEDRLWYPGSPPADDRADWLRATTISQFNVSDLLDDGVLNDPLPAGTDPVFVHVKQVQVGLAHARTAGNPLGGRNNFRLRLLKTF